jgi:threonyl-tRNA synthetase
VPYLLIAGDRERAEGGVAVRTRKGEDLGIIPLPALAERLTTEVVGRIN